MGSWAELRVGGTTVASFKSVVPPEVWMLFTRRDFTTRSVDNSESPPRDQFEFVLPVRHMLDRLATLGFGAETAPEAFDELVAEELERERSYAEDPRMPQADPDPVAALDGMTLTTWRARLRERIDAGDVYYRDDRVGQLGWLLGLWDERDVRVALRATAEALSEHDVTLDITALIDGGWLDADVDPQSEAQNAIAWTLAHSAPPIVLTEGRFDVEVLTAAISVLRPHLDGYLRFADFELKPEGNAPALVRTARAFAAAGVANRVIILFDNDTAGALAVARLAETQLPQNFTVLQLPEIATGRKYPTVHPAGRVEDMDINGYAGAIELYLGADALTSTNGLLEPVRWRGYNDSLHRHQGELTNKKAIQARFRDKVKAATRDYAERAGQDWGDLAAVLDLILETLSRPTH